MFFEIIGFHNSLIMILFLFFSKNPNRQFFDFGIFRKRFLSPVVPKLNSHSSYEESVALDLDLMSQRNPSPNLSTVSSSFGPYFGNALTLGLCYTKATSFPRVGWCIKVLPKSRVTII
jgi:hypothetical protein